jgi:predicted transposase YdaD
VHNECLTARNVLDAPKEREEKREEGRERGRERGREGGGATLPHGGK